MIVRSKVVLIIAVVGFVVFLGYSVPSYYQLFAHQPGHGSEMTSFPALYAFVIGGWFGVLSFVGVRLIFFVIRAVMAFSLVERG